MTPNLDEIRDWRKREYDAGRPSSLRDYFNAHGICFTCKGMGGRLIYDADSLQTAWEECGSCGGSGKAEAQS